MATVMIVDDDNMTLQYVRRIIEAGVQAAEIAMFRSARDAMAYIHDIKVPDLIVMDIDMPDLNGMEAVKRIRAKGYDMPVVFLSGIGDSQATEQCLEFGNAIFIDKPGTGAEIKAAVEKLLPSV